VSPPRRRRTATRGGKSQARRRRAPARDFWGPTDGTSDEIDMIRPPADPTVLVRSLGPPPLPAHGTAAQHYFDAVYEKAASLAVALAAASGLLAPDTPDDTTD
jgi:hypothetical protein